jgi:hypothetical protein
MSALPSVSVVIPTLNRPDRLGRVIQMVVPDDATTEVIVVVDGPDTGLPPTEANLLRDKKVQVLFAGECGSGDERGQRARDVGVRAARCDVIVALDDDVVPDHGVISGHARWHTDRDDLVVLGYMPVSPESTSVTGQLYGREYEAACAQYRLDSTAILRGLWGGNFSVRRLHWLDVLRRPVVGGGFHGDLELGFMFLELGLTGVIDPSLRAHHCYSRRPRDFIGDAGRSAAAHYRLHKAYPRLLPAPERAFQHRSPQVALATRLACSDACWPAVYAAMTSLRLLGLIGRWPASQLFSIRVLRGLAYQRSLAKARAAEST